MACFTQLAFLCFLLPTTNYSRDRLACTHSAWPSSTTRYFQGARHGQQPTAVVSCHALLRPVHASPPQPHPELAPPPRRRTSGAAKQTTQAEEEMSESDGKPGHKLSPADSRAVMLAFFLALGATRASRPRPSSPTPTPRSSAPSSPRLPSPPPRPRGSPAPSPSHTP